MCLCVCVCIFTKPWLPYATLSPAGQLSVQSMLKPFLDLLFNTTLFSLVYLRRKKIIFMKFQLF